MNMRKRWDEVHDDDRMTGFWIMVWNLPGQIEGYPPWPSIWHQWTEGGSRKYAEAVQNEFGAGTEGLTSVWDDPDNPGNITTSDIRAIDPDVSGEGWRIKHQLAPSTWLSNAPGEMLMRPENHTDAIILGKRDQWSIEITPSNDYGDKVRVITEGFDEDRYLPDLSGTPVSIKEHRNHSPHGVYDADTSGLGALEHGTSAYWDGRQDENGVDGERVTGAYVAFFVLNGDRVSAQPFATVMNVP